MINSHPIVTQICEISEETLHIIINVSKYTNKMTKFSIFGGFGPTREFSLLMRRNHKR